jgi:hypothetical protein
MSKGNILKDSFYKERLARTSKKLINAHTTNFAPPPEEDSETETATPEELQIDPQEHLTDFGKTSDGSTFAFLSFVCTHKRLPALRVPPPPRRTFRNSSCWSEWISRSIACGRCGICRD